MFDEKSMETDTTIWLLSDNNVNYLSQVTRPISSTKIGWPVIMMDVKVSKNKHISRWIDLENRNYVRWNRIKNLV